MELLNTIRDIILLFCSEKNKDFFEKSDISSLGLKAKQIKIQRLESALQKKYMIEQNLSNKIATL